MRLRVDLRRSLDKERACEEDVYMRKRACVKKYTCDTR